MKKAVELIVKSLVSEPDAAQIDEVDNGKSITFEVRVPEKEIGRLIGREGRTVKAVRSLLFYAGQKSGKRLSLDIVE